MKQLCKRKTKRILATTLSLLLVTSTMNLNSFVTVHATDSEVATSLAVTEEVYAVYDGTKFFKATQEAPTVATSTEIPDTDKKTINHLYIKGTSVPQTLMFQCENLKTVECADSVTVIEDLAFGWCSNLSKVSIPNVTEIGPSAFLVCTTLSNIEMSNVKQIGQNAFNSCDNLTSLVMPKVKTIGEKAFYGADSLNSLILGGTPPTVGGEAFSNISEERTIHISSNSSTSSNVLKAYKDVNDGNTNDNLWYGWQLPETVVSDPNITYTTGSLITNEGKTTVDIGTDNEITLTATFKKEKYQSTRAVEDNKIVLKNGKTVIESKSATINQNGNYTATFTLNTKNWNVGINELTAQFTGNDSVIGVTSAITTVNVTYGYVVYDADKDIFYKATEDAPTVATSTIIKHEEKEYIRNLYIKGTSVPTELMRECNNLETVICADSVTQIGELAFYYCQGLTRVSMPKVTHVLNNAFGYCRNLENVEMPKVISVGDYAFGVCNIKSLNLPYITTIGDHGFTDCGNLTSINMPNVTSIGIGAFNNCKSLINISIPNATSIGDSAFSNCTNLINISMPNVTLLGYSVFSNCTNLTSVNMPNVTAIGNLGFYDCTNLTSINIPSVTSIGNQVFSGCKRLTSLTLGKVVPTVGNGAFDNCPSPRELNVMGYSIEALENYTKGGQTEWNGWTIPSDVVSPYVGSYDVNKTVEYGTTTPIKLLVNFKSMLNTKPTKEDESDITLFHDGEKVESKAATYKDGDYSAKFSVDTNKFNVGSYKYSATRVSKNNVKDEAEVIEITVTAATPLVKWENDKQTISYTGKPISEDALNKLNITLKNDEVYKGAIKYSYKLVDGSSYTDELPTAAGKYEIKAYVEANGNYKEAVSTNTLMLTIEASDVPSDGNGNTNTGETNKPDQITEQDKENNTVETGDTSHVSSYVWVLVLAGIVVAVVYRKRMRSIK